MAAHPILTAIAAIGIGIAAYDKFTESADELAERIEGVTTSYREQHDSLVKLKGDYDTSNQDSMISKYGELSKGVNALGENVSLTSDEYSEYQSIVDTIAGQFPSLVTGYNSQGDAILSCAGNVDKLTESYKNLIKEQNDKVLDTGSDIFKDFKNDLKETTAYYKEMVVDEDGEKYVDHFDTKHFDELEKLMNLSDDNLEKAVSELSFNEVERISSLLDEQGIERNLLGSGEKGWETQREHIIRALGKDKAEIKEILDEAAADLNAYAEDLSTVTEAYFSTAFLGGDSNIGDYSHLSERMQSIISQVTSAFDTEFYADFLDDENPYESLTKYFDEMLSTFDNLNNSDAAKFEAAFDLQTKFNGGEISYGEYVKGIQDAGKLIDGLGLDEEVVSQIKLALNTEEVTENYEALKNRLTSDEYNIQMKTEEAEKFLNGLSSSEYSVAIDLIANGDIDFSDFNIDSLRDYIKKQAKLQEAMSFTIAMDVETESIEALNTAMAESVSGAGLSSEAITALKGRYAELTSQGYDLSSMFEETSNGIHLNRNAVNEFEQALASQKLSETESNLGVLKDRYDELTDEIKNCTDAGERASLYNEQQTIAQKINDLATLASQYEGLTSAYQTWQSVEESGSERGMYESIIEGFETVGDEIKRGWLDDGTVKFLELLTGRTDLATLSAKELKEVYKGLDKEIKNTSYSVRDFFTVDEDGNSTSTGVYNFLKAVEELKKNGVFKGKENLDKLIQRDEETGKITGFNFDVVGGDEAIAEALGISEELVQIMQRAADDAGFVVTLDGNWTQLADLKTSAETANDTLKKLKSEGLDSLKDTDLNFDFDANNLEDLNAQLEKSLNVLDKFKDKNGKLKTDKNGNLIEGAEEALEIASYFTATIDKLTEPVYMQLEANQVEKDLQKPLEKMQEFERLSKEKHQLELVSDTEGVEKVDKEMSEIAKYLDELDEETQIKLGIEGLTQEEIKSKLEKGEIEIPATVDIQLEMSEDIKDMRLMMMNQLGLISDEQLKLEIEYDVDSSAVEEYTPEQQKAVVEYFAEHEEVDNYTPEQKKAVVKLVAEKDNIDDWSIEDVEATIKYFVDDSDLKEWTPLEKRGLAKYIADGGELEGWTPEEKRGIAKYIADGNEVDGWTPEEKKAIARYIADGGDVSAYTPEEKRAFAKYLVDGGDPANYQPSDKSATVKFEKDSSEPDNYNPPDPKGTVTFNKDTSAIDNWKPVVTGVAKFALSMVIPQSIRTALSKIGISIATGTANVNGTAFANGAATKLKLANKSGKALKQGDWGVKKTETALTGELGQELVVYGNRFWTVGDTGAEFANIPKGAIVFNHRQTEEIFKYGKVTSGGGRGRIFANGTAFAQGTAYGKGSDGGIEPEVTSIVVGTNKITGKSYTKSSSSSDSAKDFEETFDWIEIAIDRVERAIDQLDTKANSVYRSWSERNSNLTSEISKVSNEISLQQKAYQEYMNAANGVGLSSSWAAKVRNGTIDISTVKDEVLAEKISDYKKYYETALDCKDAILELQEAESKLIQQKFDNIIDRYDGYLAVIEHEKNILEEYINQSEAQGWLVSEKYYEALADNERQNITKLQQEKNELLSRLGDHEEGTQQWYDNVAAIDEITEAIEAGNTALLEYGQTIEELKWEQFDVLQDKISAVTEEADFLIELLSNKKLFDDKGQLTNEGMSTMGLHGQNYNTYMYQADLVAEEIKRLEEELAKNPYNEKLAEEYRERISQQQEYILSAEDEKNAIRDLVEEGIEFELDALQELIDKHNEALDSQKDLYDYQRKVKEQTEEIATLEKQMAAYEGDDSEEARQKIQQIKVDLESAREDLEEAQYERYIADQEKLLDDLYLEYETILNERLDNIDVLIMDMITEINANAGTISSTLYETADSVGITFSDSMQTIWDSASLKMDESSTNMTKVVELYGKNFADKQTLTNNALNAINTNTQSMITQLNSIAKTKVKSASTSSASKSTQASKPVVTTPTTTTPNKTNSSGGDGKPKIGDKVTYVSGQYYYDSQGKKPLGSKYKGKQVYITNINTRDWATHGYHISTGNKLGKGDLGWLKLSQLSGYATGKKNFLADELAWTQEDAQELIVRPSDRAILTPIAKGDSVLNAAASNNIWDMANSPAEFIKNNLNLGTSVPNNSNSQNTYTQHLDKVVFNLPNVKNYDELLSAMQKDKNFENLILSMSIDRLAGKSSLTKGKSIR